MFIFGISDQCILSEWVWKWFHLFNLQSLVRLVVNKQQQQIKLQGDFKTYSGLWPLSATPQCKCVCTQWLVKHQRCSRTDRVKKIHNIWRKTQYLMNTLYFQRRKDEKRFIFRRETTSTCPSVCNSKPWRLSAWIPI